MSSALNGTPDSALTSRRQLLKGGASAGLGLIIAFHWTSRAVAEAGPIVPGSFAPNAFIRVSDNDVITVISKHTEFGQGIFTGVATIVAEEMDADWAQMRVEPAPADEKLYGNALISGRQSTGGSLSIADSWRQLREASATARAVLIAAASSTWKVPASELTVERGTIRHTKSTRTGRYGDFVAKALTLPIPAAVSVKEPRDFRLFGQSLHRIGAAAMVDGTMRYTIDKQEPGTRIALVLHPPRFGAVVKQFEAEKAKSVPGVIDVFQIPTGVAVVAKSFWSAKGGREALQVVWDNANAEMRSTSNIVAQYRELAKQGGKSAATVGDAEVALANATRRLSATFDLPYLSHAPMEPMSVVCRLTGDSCDIWSGTRSLTADHNLAARITGLRRDQIRIHSLQSGGAFGRRGPSDAEYKAEAVEIARALGSDGIPVKVVWTREDDIRSGMYRPMVHHALEAGLDANGKLIAWRHRIVGQAMLSSGASDLPYTIPNFAVETHEVNSAVTTSPLRSVDHSHTAFATEVFLDEIAFASGHDPVELRRALLMGKSRYLGVLNLAAERAGWGERLPQGRGRGIAVHRPMGSWVAHVADVTVNANGDVKVDRIVCAVDCGIAINPDIIRAQIEGGAVFGLGHTLHEAITLKDGKVEQSNFNDYRVIRMGEVPKIEVHIVPSSEEPTGIGEIGVPPVAPAVTNAIFAATGRRLRSLPLRGNFAV